MRSPDTPQFLRRSVLCLELVNHATSLCSQLRNMGEPLLVRLSKGILEQRVAEDLGRLSGKLYLDRELDATGCVAALLAVAAELTLRFREYTRWPFAAWQLTQRFNSDFYTGECLDFLNAPAEVLDTR